jgi:hypothetical protein
MRCLLLTLGLLFIAGPCWGAAGVVQSNALEAFSTTVNNAFGSNVGAHHAIILLEAGLLGKTVNAPTDTLGLTWTAVAQYAPGAVAQIEAWYNCDSGSGGADTINFSTTTNDVIHTDIYEVSGLATSSCLDKTGTSDGTTSPLSVSTSSGTTASNEFITVIFADLNGMNPTMTLGAYTSLGTLHDSTLGGNTVSGWSVTNTAGINTETCTASTVAADNPAEILAFKLASAGVGGGFGGSGGIGGKGGVGD